MIRINFRFINLDKNRLIPRLRMTDEDILIQITRIYRRGLNENYNILGLKKDGNRTFYYKTGALYLSHRYRNTNSGFNISGNYYAKYLEQKFSPAYSLTDYELNLLIDDYLKKLFK